MSPPAILRAGHVAFRTTDLDRARAFYVDLLGFVETASDHRTLYLRGLEEMAKHQYVNSTAFADIHLGLGEKEKALDWLDVAYENQESACWLLKVDPIYDNVRNEPRFQALVQKIFGSNL